LPKKYDYHRPIPLRHVASSGASARPRAATEPSTDIEAPLVSSGFTDSSSDLPPSTASSTPSGNSDHDSSIANADGLAAVVAASGDDSKRSTSATNDEAQPGSSENDEDVCPICT
jgi:hypothetical protein